MELAGKKIAFLGDSITYGFGLKNPEHDRYTTLLEKKYGLIAYNYGESGTRIAYQKTPTPLASQNLFFCGRMMQMPLDADAVIVYGGVNDYISGDAPMGKSTDTEFVTFFGALEYLMHELEYRYQGKPIAFVTPAHCAHMDDSRPSERPTKTKESAYPLKAYADAVKEKCREHSIPCLDLFNCFSVDVRDAGQCEEYTLDKLHFNEKGQKMLAEAIGDFLEKL